MRGYYHLMLPRISLVLSYSVLLSTVHSSVSPASWLLHTILIFCWFCSTLLVRWPIGSEFGQRYVCIEPLASSSPYANLHDAVSHFYTFYVCACIWHWIVFRQKLLTSVWALEAYSPLLIGIIHKLYFRSAVDSHLTWVSELIINGILIKPW